ncbi:HAD family hydrolase, partial [Gryllotalpicola reticulitermitis]
SGRSAMSSAVEDSAEHVCQNAQSPALRTDAVLLDFFNTLAVRRSIDQWIADAEDRTGLVDIGTRAEVSTRLPGVWSEARMMFPDADWDLDPASHRDVFLAVVGRSGAVPPQFAAALYDVMPKQVALNAGAAEFVHAANRHGVKLAVVSNTALDIRPVLREWQLLCLFDVVTLSFEAGCVKPNPRIFNLTADALRVDPARCLMIGDSAAEDGGAIAAGMQCIVSEPSEMWRVFERVADRLS